MRLKEKLFNETCESELEKVCMWIGSAFFENYITREMNRKKLFYAETGCYGCNGYEPRCDFYESEKTLITKKLDKERDSLHTSIF